MTSSNLYPLQRHARRAALAAPPVSRWPDLGKQSLELKMLNLKWRKAMAVAGQAFTVDQQNAGWPERMSLRQVAALQVPFLAGQKSRAASHAMYRALLDACEAGDLPHGLEILPPSVPEAPAAPNGSGPHGLGPSEFELRAYHEAIERWQAERAAARPTPVHRVAAGDLRAWMQAQGEEPSVHIQAWFEALALPAVRDMTARLGVAPTLPAAEPEWTGARLLEERKRLVAQGFTDPIKRLACMSGLDGRKIRHLIEAAKKVVDSPMAKMSDSLTAKRGSGRR